jgi:hypothetical protein
MKPLAGALSRDNLTQNRAGAGSRQCARQGSNGRQEVGSVGRTSRSKSSSVAVPTDPASCRESVLASVSMSPAVVEFWAALLEAEFPELLSTIAECVAVDRVPQLLASVSAVCGATEAQMVCAYLVARCGVLPGSLPGSEFRHDLAELVTR